MPSSRPAALVASEASEREQAELLRRHVVPAPFAGVVARRLTDVGEWVSRGTPVIELVATDRVRLDVQAPQERFAAIREDAIVQVFADSLGGESLPGRVVARVPVSDPSAARSWSAWSWTARRGDCCPALRRRRSSGCPARRRRC